MKNLFSKTKLLLLGLLLQGGIASAQQFITLDKAMEIAMEHSPSIRTSLLALERSQQLLKAQKAALKSQFTLSLTPVEYSKNRTFDDYTSTWYTNESFASYGTFTVAQPVLLTDGTISLVNQFGWQNSNSTASGIENKVFTNTLNLAIDQPLFTYNKLKLELKTLELDLENSNLSYAMAKLNLEKQVSQYFYNVYLAQMSLSIAQDELKNTKATYEITKNKVDAGLSAMEELYQAELNYATSQSDVQNQQVSLDNAKDIFKQYIGMDIFEEIMVMTDVNVNPVEIDSKKAIEYGLSSRMEIRQREIDVESSQFDLITTKAENEFKGDVALSIGLIGENEKLNNIFETPTRNPRVSVAFNVPLFDWGEKKARIKAQEAVIQSTQLDLEEEKKQIIIDIRSVCRTLDNDRMQIDIAKQNERNAQLTYEINEERYKNGDLTGMDLSLYQTQLSEQKMAYAQALIDYKIELLNLKVQSLYDFEKQEPIVPQEIIDASKQKK
ncbi:TolC family protein [Mangrovibacterium diazotrophicum]|uniref:Outer membrane protein TolC n=1 Tax=Mangrovibacterium diazotrophicum TaxID=1261403 RepID=A0A419WBL7_9BACT|nr:TolC family protein [Mangrovibacterium diazotrophicum]RKD92814.1 outer membrane protein TolC [Mangrovibacterium diazotrophicum]